MPLLIAERGKEAESAAQEIEFYKRQFRHTANSLLEAWKVRFSGNQYKHPVLRDLLTQFQSFGRDYLDYIGEQTKVQHGNKIGCMRRDIYHALGHLADELNIITRACEQRQNTIYRHALKQAESEALIYYKRFNGYKAKQNGEPITPIPYFEKVSAITRYVFTPFPVISVPLRFMNLAKGRRCGLAHEMGHHFYWNSTPAIQADTTKEARLQMRGAIQRAINECDLDISQEGKEGLIEIWQTWQEETVADIFGVLLVGPEYVEMLQRLEDEKAFTDDDLIEDDSEHPSPCIRPRISIHVLKWIAKEQAKHKNKDELDKKCDHLESEWREFANTVLDKVHPMHNELTMQNIVASIPCVIPIILDSPWPRDDIDAKEMLGRLINYQEWLDHLTDPVSLTEDSPIPLLDENPSSFHAFLDGFRKRSISRGQTSEEESYKSLLKLDLGEDDPQLLSGCHRLETGGAKTHRRASRC